MKKIIAFSLWGNNPKYNIGAIKNVHLAKTIYPGWICRFYCGKSVPTSTIDILREQKNCEVFIQEEDGDWTGMFWRFYTMSDPSVEVMLSRDCDSRLCLREAQAVEEWLKSDKDFHIMRDHPWHTAPIMGGMWGARCALKFKLGYILHNKLKNYLNDNRWQVDQDFLRDCVFTEVMSNSMVHGMHQFPTPRNGLEFVGAVFDENDKTVEEHKEVLARSLGK